ncbi:hypothetical protein EWM64_g5619 [Hericium alpestre]|uniref:BTB domain-containing protein n=1 Tax=Hericium alpestre TaxID=135208 RepID=A0A4Y9ZW31_9AGAM|nr:hypothetical protein EWM64_g5619 [Hericium alpestre]
MAPKRPNKRCRELEDEPGQAASETPTVSAPTQTWTSHPELWLEHGDIVLVCEKTGFRVGKCVLAANSSVFGEMFTAAAAHGEMFEGLPVLHLEDSEGDMYYLLKAMHLRLDIHRANFVVLAPLLKLSSKYRFANLRADTINILAAIFPSTLISFSNTWKHLPADLDCFLAVELAQQYDVPIILPAAYYLSALRSARVIINIGSASLSTRSCCMVFRDELMDVVDKTLKDSYAIDTCIWKDKTHEDNILCPIDKCCHLRLNRTLCVEMWLRRLAGNIFTPSRVLIQPEGTGRACKSIETMLDRHWSSIQQKIWHSLPSLCGFQDWEAIKAAHEASLRTTNEKQL